MIAESARKELSAAECRMGWLAGAGTRRVTCAGTFDACFAAAVGRSERRLTWHADRGASLDAPAGARSGVAVV